MGSDTSDGTSRSSGDGDPDANGSEATYEMSVSLRRTQVPATEDQVLWTAIRTTTTAISFDRFERFLDSFLQGRSKRTGLRLCLLVAATAFVAGVSTGITVS